MFIQYFHQKSMSHFSSFGQQLLQYSCDSSICDCGVCCEGGQAGGKINTFGAQPTGSSLALRTRLSPTLLQCHRGLENTMSCLRTRCNILILTASHGFVAILLHAFAMPQGSGKCLNTRYDILNLNFYRELCIHYSFMT